MFSTSLVLASLALVGMAVQLEPRFAAVRLGVVFASLLAFALVRPVLPGGGFQRLVVVAMAFGVAVGWAADLSPSHTLALGFQGALAGVFMGVLDLFTLRRENSRRLYNFAVVLGVIFPGWYFVAVWIPFLQFPRPALRAALGAELAGALALSCACLLAAPGLERAPGPGLPPVEKVPIPPDLVAGAGAGGVPVAALETRDTVPAPAVEADPPRPPAPGQAPAPDDSRGEQHG